MPFQPIPGSKPLTVFAAITPPLAYFLALVLLPPFQDVSPQTRQAISILRNFLAVAAAILFARLPICYHVPWSAGLTYILSLTGWYGASRVIDLFYISGRKTIPRRVKRNLREIDDTDSEAEAPEEVQQTHNSSNGANGDSKLRRRSPRYRAIQNRRRSMLEKLQDGDLALADIRATLLQCSPVGRQRDGVVHIEKAVTEEQHQPSAHWAQRVLYAIDLETSMRGVGWTWTTADVRHSKRSWLPTLQDEFIQLFFSDIPMVAFAFALEKYLWQKSDPSIGIESLNYFQRGLLTLSQGVFLFGTFSAGYTSGAILTSPLRKRYRQWTTHNLAFWPPLNSQPLIEVTTVRQFWSRSWHRLFSRLFLVWGVWPGQWLERHLLPAHIRNRFDKNLDIGKVVGAFFISGIVHAAAGISINGGHPTKTFEWLFFWCSGLAVIVEEVVQKLVLRVRKAPLHRWYDPWIGRVWTLTVLLWSGQYFTKGWYDSGLVEEMVTLPITAMKSGLEYAISGLSFILKALDSV